ncbi:MAG: DUF1189 family protein [Candidatus Pacebacteria bacterium]|nr:DUF1189 family protein [Candidatus Paceibacterota bacterium]
MKKYFNDLLKALGSSDYYKQASSESTSNGLIFNLKTSLLVGIFGGIVAIIFVLGTWPTVRSEARNFVDMYYPTDLVMTFSDGTLTTNTTEPIVIASTEGELGDNDRKNVIAIASNEKASVDLNDKYDALIVLASDGLVGEKENETRIIGYENFGDTVLTKESSLGDVDMLARLLLKVTVFSAIPILIIVAMVFVFVHMLWLLLVGAVIFIVFKVRKLPYTYKQSYRIGLRAISPLLVIELVAVPLGFSGRILTSVVILGIVLFATKDWNNVELQKPAEEPTLTTTA